MKPNKLFISLLIVFFCSLSFIKLFAQWYPQGPNPYDYRLNDLDFVDENYGWIAGQNGKLLKTINGGASWEELTIEVAGSFPNLSAISFMDQYTGLVSTSEGVILKTIDAGLSWVVLKESDGINLPFLYYFGEVAYAGGYDHIFRMNGDDNVWEYIDLNTYLPYQLTDFHFINETTGWFCIEEIQGGGYWYTAILKTTNGFESWETIANEPYGGPFRAFCLNEEQGWTSAGFENEPSGMYRTNNSGYSWSFSLDKYGSQLFFISMNKGWIANGHTIYGYWPYNWSEQFTSEYSFSDIEFVDDQKGWCIGNKVDGGVPYESQIFYTETGGYTNIGFQDTKFNIEEISISPNPCKDFITIQGIHENIKELSYSIVSINGNNLVSAGVMQIEGSLQKNKINTTTLEKGIYIVTLFNPQQTLSYKIVKI